MNVNEKDMDPKNPDAEPKEQNAIYSMREKRNGR